jgi:hypothetical protein
MSPTSSQQWMRRLRNSDQHIRVSDADRNAVAEVLTKHYADGRLDQAEFDERVGQTMAAKTRGDLTGLFDDLPEVDDADPDGFGAAAETGQAGPTRPYRPGRDRGRRRGGLLRTLLLVAAVLIGANIAWHAFSSLFYIGPLVWAFVIVAAVLVISRARRSDR